MRFYFYWFSFLNKSFPHRDGKKKLKLGKKLYICLYKNYILFCFDNLNIRISCNSNFEHNHFHNNRSVTEKAFKKQHGVNSSKKIQAGKLSKIYITLDEKIKILDVVKKRKMSCREIADQFKIGNTQAANIVKNEASLRVEYENIQGKGFKHLKRENHQKHKVINTNLYK